MVRSSDKKSPREAVEFILQLLKYNDNNGNTYSDVFWVAALIQSVGELEFGEQSIAFLPSLLKRLDRLLQFDRLMPSHNGILTVSCIHSLTQMALKLSEFVSLDNLIEIIRLYRVSKTCQIRVAASRALLELESQCKGTDAALKLFIRYLNDETSLRGQAKLGICALRLSQMTTQPDCGNDVNSDTLVALLRLLESPLAFNNITLRHYIFCILQVLAGRAPTLYGVPRDETLRMGHTKTCSELKNIFAALIKQSKIPEPPCAPDVPQNLLIQEVYPEGGTFLQNHEFTQPVTNPSPNASLISDTQLVADATNDGSEQRALGSHPPEDDMVAMPEAVHEPIKQVANSLADPSIDAVASGKADTLVNIHQEEKPVLEPVHDSLVAAEATNEPDTISNSREIKKPKLKIRVKQSAASSRSEDPDKVSGRAENPDNARILNTQDVHTDADRGASSSVSVDAPRRIFTTVSAGNQNFEDANSYQDVDSRVTASIGSVKPTIDGEEFVKELQCTADSSKVSLPLPPHARLPTSTIKMDGEPQSSEHFHGKDKEKKKDKDKDKKRKKNGHNADPEHKELKRQKKEKKRKEKEMAKLLAEKPKSVPPLQLPSHEKSVAEAVILEAKPTSLESGGKEHLSQPHLVGGERAASSKMDNPGANVASVQLKPGEVNVGANRNDSNANAPQSAASHKIKIKFKNRTLGKP